MKDQALSVSDLEEIYRLLARAIDVAGPEKESLLLTKLVLLLASRAEDLGTVQEAIDVAVKDL